jgi:serine/threonine-protein kinase
VVEDYRAALYLLARPERRAESMAHLLRVTAGDPEFAAGHAHLAEALFWAQRLEPARAAARRALELDHRSARAHFLLGNVLLFADRDWAGARVALERALELAPQDAELRTGYAFLLAAQGEAGRARTQVRRALEQDMVTASVLADAGAILRWSGDPDGARGACARALELEPELTWAADCVARLQVERGQDVDRKALAHLVRQAGEEPPAVLATGPDRTTLAQTWRAWELNRLERAHASPEIWYRRALAYADAGRRDAALAALERAVAGRARSVLTLAVEPRLAGLRSEPRFRALVAVLGLTPASPAPIF